MLGMAISTVFFYLVYSKNINKKLEHFEVVNTKNISFSPFINENDIIKVDTSFIEKLIDININHFDTTLGEIKVSDSSELEIPYIINQEDRTIVKKIFSGKRINIALTGVDSRIGEKYKHADANHIISILPDNNFIEIFSIPRDTYADAGFNLDSLDNFNLLTNVLGKQGRKKYLEELARISELDKIHYYIEIGFSQAIGLIEKLGFSNPKVTLQLLRDRKSYRIGDYQRTYNQGIFIKKSLIKSKDLIAESNDYIVSFFLNMVNTNLSIIEFNNILNSLKINEISENKINNFVKPKIYTKFEELDLYNEEQYKILSEKIDFNVYDNTSEYVAGKLLEILDEVEEFRNSQLKVNKLLRYYEQRAWLQISDLRIRNVIKDRFKNILVEAYTDLGKYKDAQNVINIDYN
jgi:anionic cell wall polymer biosynthesis LytR-Cps2A-Psr (LCP) family protein